ncbi:phage holin [Lactiplantibacillus pentosus]|uniref:phage holin n=2 Tax=Lactiplantibacillus pentosus TaxID=1589 RepID=UPI001C1F8A17|nr:phage holin [Lactiplantibacillus pentosus]MBU7465923.1 holin [Lactiplantibacillus pentosus]MBU7489681.1 holin [Lactiplantibacillus pentosus]MDT6964766.1 phage holin [Lactiplantibacillus pentosus]MDT6968139.1 phage holin [Lactiplantibacillus pentosus]MDT6968204.1 phage holin [Lactiplantibacillus pentosus]
MIKKISFKNVDGSLNGKLIAGIISLLIVLIQQVLAVFGIKFAGDWSAIVAVINTVLTILGMLGVVTDVQTVTAPTVVSDEESQVEAAANKVADEAQAPTSTVAVVNSSASSDTETTSESASQAAK